MEMSSSSSSSSSSAAVAAAAAAASSSMRRPADRRTLYRRSNTVSSLPLDDLPSTASERRRPLEPIIDSPVHDAAATTTTADTTTTSSSREEQTKQPQSQPAGRTSSAGAPPRHGGKTSDGRRAQFCRKTSCNDLLLSANSGSGARPLYPATVTAGLSDATSGRLLSKVKERIREKLLQTTPEWPAVVQERRQRAAIQFEMRAAKRMADGQRAADTAAAAAGTGTKGCEQVKVVAASAVERREAARAAFRGSRSASCEDAVSTLLHPTSAGRRQRRGSPSGDMGGIVCSSKDLQSIIELSRQQQQRQQLVGDYEKPTSSVDISGSTTSTTMTVQPDVVGYRELPGEPSPGTRRCPTASDEISQSLTVEADIGCSDATTSVSEAQTVDGGGHSLTTSATEDVSSAAVGDVAADCEAASTTTTTTKPTDVKYDDEGQTWDVYGAALNPEALDHWTLTPRVQPGSTGRRDPAPSSTHHADRVVNPRHVITSRRRSQTAAAAAGQRRQSRRR